MTLTAAVELSALLGAVATLQLRAPGAGTASAMVLQSLQFRCEQLNASTSRTRSQVLSHRMPNECSNDPRLMTQADRRL